MEGENILVQLFLIWKNVAASFLHACRSLLATTNQNSFYTFWRGVAGFSARVAEGT